MSAPEILPLIMQALAGLGEAHHHGIVHRDISPDNMMISPHPSGREQVIIIDFGIAKAFTEKDFSETLLKEFTVDGSFVGKVAYCSPEQAAGEALDGRSDLYSLGLVLHRALTGTIPFHAETPVESLAYRRIKDPPTLSDSLPSMEFHAELEEILQKSLSREAADRYQTAGEFIQDVQSFLQLLGVPADEPATTLGLARPPGSTNAVTMPVETVTETGAPLLKDGEPTEDETRTMLPDATETITVEPATDVIPSHRKLYFALASCGLVLVAALIWLLLLDLSPDSSQTTFTADGRQVVVVPSVEPTGPALYEGLGDQQVMPRTNLLGTVRPANLENDGETTDSSGIKEDVSEGMEKVAPDPGMVASLPHTPEPARREIPTPVPIPRGYVRIRSGSFQMGSPREDRKYFSMAEQRHSVALTQSFYLSSREVTQGKWQAMMGSNPSKNKDSNLPVENITWYDAIIFCNRLSIKSGLKPCYYSDSAHTQLFDGKPPVQQGEVYWNTQSNGYRLPTEAEWEYACRAGSKSPFFFGTTDTNLSDYSWFQMNSSGTTHPPGEKKPNKWGLYDIYGNVMEWCWDWHDSYSDKSRTNPGGAKSGTARTIRGGNWRDNARKCRSAARYSNYPGFRSNQLGFRLARSPG